MNTTNIAKHFNISARELNKIFEELQWIYKKDRWWLTTELGKEKGAKEYYDVKTKTKYIKWNPNIKNNSELINKIYDKKPKQNENIGYGNFKQETKKKMTNKEKKEKGDKYEKYIAEHYRKQGYIISEHGIDNNVKDCGIDIIAKKEKEILFIQCKNWDKNKSRKIKDIDIKKTRIDVKDYIEKNPIYELYKIKTIYITSENILHGSAYHHIKEHNKEIEYKIIPIIN